MTTTDTIVLLLTGLAIAVAYFQLLEMRKHKRIEFTYQLYRDFFDYVNEEKNKDVKDWLMGENTSSINKNKIGDLLEQFEAVWSLQNKKQIDNEMLFDLFGYYIIKASEAKSPSSLEYIEQERSEVTHPEMRDTLHIGYLTLLAQMERKRTIQSHSFKKGIKLDVFKN